MDDLELHGDICLYVRTMEIKAELFYPIFIFLTYKGFKLPNVNKSVFLGIGINNNLNIKQMAKFRLTKGKYPLKCLRKYFIIKNWF